MEIRPTSELIQAAALELFIKKGFKDTSIAEIAERAGIAVGTVYRHFKDKEGLFRSLGRPELRFRAGDQKERKKDRKTTILEAALQIFSKEGFHGATLDQIAAEAHISKAAVYRYFSGKEELFSALIRFHTPPMQFLTGLALTDTAQGAGDARRNLTLLATSFLSLFEDPRRANLLRLMLSEMPRFPEAAAVFFSAIVDTGINGLTRYFERLREIGYLKAPSATAARSFIGVLVSLVVQHHIIRNSPLPLPDKDRTVAELVGLFLDGAREYQDH